MLRVHRKRFAVINYVHSVWRAYDLWKYSLQKCLVLNEFY